MYVCVYVCVCRSFWVLCCRMIAVHLLNPCLHVFRLQVANWPRPEWVMVGFFLSWGVTLSVLQVSWDFHFVDITCSQVQHYVLLQFVTERINKMETIEMNLCCHQKRLPDSQIRIIFILSLLLFFVFILFCFVLPMSYWSTFTRLPDKRLMSKHCICTEWSKNYTIKNNTVCKPLLLVIWMDI